MRSFCLSWHDKVDVKVKLLLFFFYYNHVVGLPGQIADIFGSLSTTTESIHLN